MVPFVLLLVVFAALSLLPRLRIDPPALRSRRARMRVALASMFLLTATTHFTATASFMQSVPEFLPLRREAIYISGVAELLGAICLLVPQLRRVAGLGLAALLVAVFPANINVAVNQIQNDMFAGPQVYQWARLALQPVLIWLAVWSTQPEGARGTSEPARGPIAAQPPAGAARAV